MRHLRIDKTLVLAWVAILLVVGAVPAAQAQVIAPELQAVLQALPAGQELSVIVTFADRPDLGPFRGRGLPRGLLRAQLVQALKARAAASQSAVQHLLTTPAVSRSRALWAINGVALTARRQAIEALARHPAVERIRLDATLAAPGPAACPSPPPPEWNLAMIGAPELWALGSTGAGVVVASMDTGVDADHPDLAGRWRGGTNSWFDPNGEHAAPYDASGHGTQTMGLLVGGSAGGTAIGVAPDAEWIAVKIFDDSGTGTLSGIHLGFQWLLDPDGDPLTDDAADVVNNSWSLGNAGGCSLEFETDIAVLKAAGIAVVFAGGNHGPTPDTSVSPANNPEGYAVGAVDAAATVMASSSRGPSACDGTTYPEVVAPGVNVNTSDLTFDGVVPDSYACVSGTSVAAPHVAGAMALLRSAHPTWSVEQLEQALNETALDIGNIGQDNDSGYGLIDLVAAQAWDPPEPICSDADADLYFAEASCGTPVDCDDFDPAIHPGACDIKGDGIDQDCDGTDRLKGKPCPGAGGDDGGGDTGGVEGKGQSCSDGLDNDLDGLVDCADPDCSRNKACR